MKPVPERLAAIAAGERYYSTSKPCKNGHLAKRYTSTGKCSVCAVNISLRYQASHASEVAAYWHSEQGKQVKRASAKRAYHRDPDKANTRTVIWRKKNPDKVKLYNKVSSQRESAKQSHILASRRYYYRNVEWYKDRSRKWQLAHPQRRLETAKISNSERRARKAGNGGCHTMAEIEALGTKQKWQCANPDCTKSIKTNYHRDHIMPISRGGSDAIENIQLLCQKCNLTKHAKDPIEWAQSMGRLL